MHHLLARMRSRREKEIDIKDEKFYKYKCSICEDLFGKDAIPKILGCGHIACKPCVQEQVRDNYGKPCVYCDHCQETDYIQHADELQTSDGLLELSLRFREKIERAKQREDGTVSSPDSSSCEEENLDDNHTRRRKCLNERSKKRHKRREDLEKKCPKCARTFHYSDHHLPKELSCDHLLCSGCVKKQKSTSVTCHVCQAVTDVSSLRTDFELLEFLGDSATGRRYSSTENTMRCKHCDQFGYSSDMKVCTTCHELSDDLYKTLPDVICDDCAINKHLMLPERHWVTDYSKFVDLQKNAIKSVDLDNVISGYEAKRLSLRMAFDSIDQTIDKHISLIRNGQVAAKGLEEKNVMLSQSSQVDLRTEVAKQMKQLTHLIHQVEVAEKDIDLTTPVEITTKVEQQIMEIGQGPAAKKTKI